MAFIILIILGLVGIAATVWISSASLRYIENPVARGEEWFSVSPEVLESRVVASVREYVRNVMKIILVWMIVQYRELSKKNTVKQTVKKKVRAFLYDHSPESVRHPSEFLTKVKHLSVRKPRKPKEPIATKQVQSETELPPMHEENDLEMKA